MTAAHYLPGDDRDERTAALYGAPETDDRPALADVINIDPPMEPLWPVEEREAETWGDPVCPRCGRNELRFAWDHQCRECDEDALEEEAHERGRGGEWQ